MGGYGAGQSQDEMVLDWNTMQNWAPSVSPSSAGFPTNLLLLYSLHLNTDESETKQG